MCRIYFIPNLLRKGVTELILAETVMVKTQLPKYPKILTWLKSTRSKRGRDKHELPVALYHYFNITVKGKSILPSFTKSGSVLLFHPRGREQQFTYDQIAIENKKIMAMVSISVDFR